MSNTKVLDKNNLPERAKLDCNATDESGHRYGELTALYPVKGKSCAWWLCRCSCGNYVAVRGYSLRQGMTKSCGHEQHKINDITGNRYGHLVVLCFVEMRKNHSYWECACDCGSKTVTRSGNLSSGRAKVCRVGCDGRPESTREDERVFKKYIESANRRDIKFNLTQDELSCLIHHVTPCCSTCNYAKASLSYNAFLEHVERIYNYQARRGSCFGAP